MGKVMTTPKRGRPAKPRPAVPSRPLAMPGAVVVLIRLTEQQRDRLDRHAKRLGMSRNAAVRNMVDELEGV
jgi:hypothetical protein